MLFDNGKMSKSLGNTYKIDDLIEMGYSALDFRYFCLNGQYRKKLNFTFEGLDGAKVALIRLRKLLVVHKASVVKTDKAILDDYYVKYKSSILNDLNVPMAMGHLWTMLKLPYSNDLYNLAIEMDNVFGLSLEMPYVEPEQEMPAEIVQLAEDRVRAKADKDYALADKLRQNITAKGYAIADTREGYTLSKE